jgi:outer membrane protein assembly factor BamB
LLLDGGVLTGLDDGRLLAMNLANGRLIWESVISLPSGRSEVERLVDVDAELRVDSSAIYVVNYQGNAASLEPVRGQLIWSVPFSSTVGLELSGHQLIIVDDEDVVHALDKSNGQELWSQAALRGRRLSPPAVNAKGDVVVGDFAGFIHVLSGDKGELVGRNRLGDERIVTRPVVIPAKSVDDTPTESSSKTSDIPALVVVQTINGNVAAYEFKR